MAVSMDTSSDENTSINGINDDDDFEVVAFPDFFANTFDVGETCCGLHHAGAVNYGTGS